ncbi:PTB-containing, cubilin and LRP1-interacting protein isoform X2 [Chanodichthys erythropterus]|uniref:PTB-containing, cubilin and LRP1-interacting protein isoform X2 n=1 Tax=Chanodichthys erythropterus TaxID=933992 RepID=UPI00351DAEDB
MWQPASERLQHLQTMLKTKLNVLTLRKDPLPTVIFHEPEAIELCSTTPHNKNRAHTGYKLRQGTHAPLILESGRNINVPLWNAKLINELHNICTLTLRAVHQRSGKAAILLEGSQSPAEVTYLGNVTISGTHFLSGCTESAVVGLCDTKRTSVAHDDSIASSNAILEIRPFQVRLHHLDGRGEATVAMDTFQVARIAYCTADHDISPNVFAWIYRQINDDLTFQMNCHAVECESKLEAKKLAHSMMEAFKKTFHSMRSDGRIHKSGSSDEFPEELSTPDDG